MLIQAVSEITNCLESLNAQFWRIMDKVDWWYSVELDIICMYRAY